MEEELLFTQTNLLMKGIGKMGLLKGTEHLPLQMDLLILVSGIKVSIMVRVSTKHQVEPSMMVNGKMGDIMVLVSLLGQMVESTKESGITAEKMGKASSLERMGLFMKVNGKTASTTEKENWSRLMVRCR